MGYGPPDWAVSSTPAVGVQATATKAASPGMAHVCTSIAATMAGTAVQTQLTVNLRDGTTGAGTILWSITLTLPAVGVVVIAFAGLAIRGTNGNAMTLEFSAAGAGTTTESVALTGYDAA